MMFPFDQGILSENAHGQGKRPVKPLSRHADWRQNGRECSRRSRMTWINFREPARKNCTRRRAIRFTSTSTRRTQGSERVFTRELWTTLARINWTWLVGFVGLIVLTATPRRVTKRQVRVRAHPDETSQTKS